MTWSNPAVLWGLLGPALAALTLIVLAVLRRHRRWTRWPGITRVVAVGARVHPVSIAHGTRRPWLLLFALVLTVVGLAGPRWGSIEEPVYQKAREVMIALDLSRSMLVQDVPPSRLERARLLVRNLLDGLRGERVGLIVFAGTAFVQVPMSADYQILEEFLPELNPAYMPQGGSDYDGMLHAAVGGFSPTADTDRYLIVLSDGEATGETWRERLAAVKERNIAVITLGIGTAQGGFIPDAKTGAFVKDERGAVVLSRLEAVTLRALAAETGGTYRDASQWVDLPSVLAETVERGRQGAFTEKRAARAIERFQWFLAPALLFALLGVWREIPARPRARHIRQSAATDAEHNHGGVTKSSRPGPAASTSAAVLALLLVLLASTRPAGAAVQNTTPQGAVERLRSTVTRLATTESVAAAGWRAMAEQTLALAEEQKTSGQPVSPGVVHDALEAVDRGEAQDPRAADWPKLRQDLLRLLEQPEEKQDEQQQQQQEQEEQENKEQKPEDSKQQKDGQQPPSDQPQQSDDQNKANDSQQQQQEQQQSSESQQDSEKKPSESPSQQQQQQQSGSEGQNQQQPQPPKEGSELGELKQDEAAPPPAEANTPPPSEKKRKFGGRPANEGERQETDPELAAAMARLRQIGENDSPARLHQMLEGEKQKQQAAQGRDW